MPARDYLPSDSCLVLLLECCDLVKFDFGVLGIGAETCMHRVGDEGVSNHDQSRGWVSFDALWQLESAVAVGANFVCENLVNLPLQQHQPGQSLTQWIFVQNTFLGLLELVCVLALQLSQLGQSSVRKGLKLVADAHNRLQNIVLVFCLIDHLEKFRNQGVETGVRIRLYALTLINGKFQRFRL